MKIFISAANTPLGLAAAKKLQARGYQLSTLIPSNSDASALKSMGVTVMHGSLLDDDALTKAVSGCDVVVHLANFDAFWSPSSQHYDEINITGAVKVMQAAMREESRQVIFLSSALVYGKSPVVPITEQSTYNDQRLSHFADSKYYGERFVRKFMEEGGLPVTILQPALMLAREGLSPGGSLFSPLTENMPPFNAFGKHSMAYIAMEDIAEAIAVCVGNPHAVGETFLLTSEILTNKAFAQKVYQLSELKPPRLTLPDWLVLLLAQMNTMRADKKNRLPLWHLSIDYARTMQTGLIVDGAYAARTLGISYTPIETVLQQCLNSNG
jgi:nucleoside-diphosphate-sugar epimerase